MHVFAIKPLNARYYNPQIGRYLSRDPDLGEDSDRLSKNEYIYGYNDPVNNDDPNGHGFWSWVKKTYKKTKSYVKKQYNRATKYIKRTVKRVEKTVRKVVKTVKKTVQRVVRTVKKTVKRAVNTVKKTVNKAVKTVKKTVRKVVNKAKNVGKKAVRTAKQVGRKVANAVVRRVQSGVANSITAIATGVVAARKLKGDSFGDAQEWQKRYNTMKKNNPTGTGDVLGGVYKLDYALGLGFGDGSSMDQLQKAISSEKYMKGKTWNKYQSAIRNDDAIDEIKYRVQWEKETFAKAGENFGEGKDGIKWNQRWKGDPNDNAWRATHKHVVSGYVIGAFSAVSNILDNLTS